MRLYFAIALVLAVLTSYAAFPSGTHNGTEGLRVLSSDSLFMLGEKAFENQDFDRASAIFSIICTRHRNETDKGMLPLFARSMNRVGNINFKRGALSAAMEYYMKARRIAEDNGLYDILPEIYANIGNVHASNDDYASALSFYEKTIEAADRSGSREFVPLVLNNMAMASYLMGNTAAAAGWLDRLMALDIRGPRMDYDLLLNKALLEVTKKQYDRAIDIYKEAAAVSESHGLPVLCLGAAFSQIADCHEKMNRPDSAIFYLHRCEAIATQMKNTIFLIETLKDLGRLYGETDDPDRSLKYKTAYLDLADSMSYYEQYSKLKSSEMLYDLDTSANTIRSLNEEKKSQRIIVAILAAGGALCLIFVIILLCQKRSLKKAWTELYERNRQGAALDMELGREEQISPADTDTAVAAAPAAARKSSLSTGLRDKLAADIVAVMNGCDAYCSPDFSIDSLADMVGSNPKYVSEVINDCFGKNFRAFLNEYRIKRAIDMLEDFSAYGNLTIKAISENVGYKSPATFISRFSKATGLKPSVYQKIARERNRRKTNGTD